MKQINVTDFFQLFCFVKAANCPALLQQLKEERIAYTLRAIGEYYKVMVVVSAEDATRVYNILKEHI